MRQNKIKMENERKFIVYKHTSPDGKIYIGMTSTTLQKRSGRTGTGYKNHIKFWNAIQNFGWDNFRHEVLYENLEELQAREMEREMIKFYQSNNPEFGYNDTEGGEKPTQHNDESKRKIAEASKTWERTPEIKKRIGEGNKGKQLSDEAKQQISASLYKYFENEEAHKRLSEAHMGKTPWNKGISRDEETKLKISDSLKGKYTGENHPNYGRHWYNNGIKQIYTYECPEGFTPGKLKRA